MKILNFSIELIEIGKPIVWIENGLIYQGNVDAVYFIFNEYWDAERTDYAIRASYRVMIGTNEHNIDPDKNILYAEDFESLVDKIECLYYKDRERQKPGAKSKARLTPVFNPGSDEEIAKRTTYLCSDGEFYTIGRYAEDHAGYSSENSYSWIVNELGIEGAETYAGAELDLFDSAGCEACRIIEIDKGRYTIQDRTCETSGFIFLSLEKAKEAALWLMEEEEESIIPYPTKQDVWYVCFNQESYYIQYEYADDEYTDGGYFYILRFPGAEIIPEYFQSYVTAVAVINRIGNGIGFSIKSHPQKNEQGDTLPSIYKIYDGVTESLACDESFFDVEAAIKYLTETKQEEKVNQEPGIPGEYVPPETMMDHINSTQELHQNTSNGYREVFLCKNGDLYYMCAGGGGEYNPATGYDPFKPTFAEYQLWKYPKGSTQQPVYTSSDHKDIYYHILKVLNSEYYMYYNNQYPGHDLLPVWEIFKEPGSKLLSTENNFSLALDLARKFKRDADHAAEIKNNTKISFTNDDAVYVIDHYGEDLVLVARITKHSEYGMYLYPDGLENFDTYWDNTVDELEKWLDKYHTLKYIIRSTSSEKPEYKVFIGRTAEDTGFVFTDKDTAVKTTLEVNMGVEQTSTTNALITLEEPRPVVMQVYAPIVSSDEDNIFCSLTREQLTTGQIQISVVYITKAGLACFLVQKGDFYRVWSFVNDDRKYLQCSSESKSFVSAVGNIQDWYCILYEVRIVFGAWRICKPGTESYIKVPGSNSLKETVDTALKYIADSKQ